MKYILMCGGKYVNDGTTLPKQLSVLCGEPLVDRTIRLLKENGVDNQDIFIRISDINVLKLYQHCGVSIIISESNYVWDEATHTQTGYWCDGLYNLGEPTTYLFGDVFYSPNAIKTIVEKEVDDIAFFGSARPFAANYIKPYVEPFAFKVGNVEKFFNGIKDFMRLQDEGKFWRNPYSWELWAVLKGVPTEINFFRKSTPEVFGENYVPINDYTCDVDNAEDIVDLEASAAQEAELNKAKLKKMIGIVSYLPNDEEERKKRTDRLDKLFAQLTKLWPEIPVVVVSQNWKRWWPKTKIKLTRSDFQEGIGILNARLALRDQFLKLGYDYMIMFDDDAIIECDDDHAHLDFLEAIDNHPDGFCFVKGGDNGLCPYVKSQLNLCAISRYIYEREPIPYIDPQKGQGFEDAVFSTLLHYKYADREFDVPKTIRSVHFKNPNIKEYGGEVPSTWSKQQKYDWTEMNNNTTNILEYIAMHKEMPDLSKMFKPPVYSASSEKIDLVIPFVDNTDPEWQRIFNIYNPEHKTLAINGANRFRSNHELFKYLFRSVEENLPWINNIFLLVQSKAQIPAWLNTSKLKVITHEQFIPEEYLPTFNSCTIEMFLWRIPGLSEKFLYGNDDFYVLKPTTSGDWFGKGDKVRFSSRFDYDLETEDFYCNQMMSNVQVITPEKKKTTFRMYHMFRPYFKSRMRDCFFRHQDKIQGNLSRFRQKNNNNCYIFNYYDYVNGYSEKTDLTHKYCSFKDFVGCTKAIRNRTHDTIVINDDVDNILESIYRDMLSALNYVFPNKSKYEQEVKKEEPKPEPEPEPEVAPAQIVEPEQIPEVIEEAKKRPPTPIKIKPPKPRPHVIKKIYEALKRS